MNRTPSATRIFFDGMSSTYDDDLLELGWSPVDVCRRWPIEVSAGDEVLDAGCGTGSLALEWARQGAAVTAFDLSPKMVRRARRRLRGTGARVEVGDLSGVWPCESARFSRAVCFGALEFVPNLRGAFQELARVLRVQGRALVSVEDVGDVDGNPLDREELRYGQFPLWRRERQDVIDALPDVLRVVRIERAQAYHVEDQGFTAAYWVLELERVAPGAP